MSIAFTSTPSIWAEMVVANLKAINPGMSGKEEQDLIDYWTAIKSADQSFLIAYLKVTTDVTIPVTAVAPLPSFGTGTSAT